MENSIFRSTLFEKLGILHGFFTKKASIEKRPLNVAFGRADSDEVVRDNRAHVAQALGTNLQLFMTSQGHTNWVRFIPPEDLASSAVDSPICDALVTTTPHVALGIYTADCVPVLLADPTVPIVGVAHGGWKGLYQGILSKTVACMQAHGAHVQNTVAAIGPCIRSESYSVGEEFAEHFSGFQSCLMWHNNILMVDLPGIARQQLEHLGVETVDDLELNTYTQPTLFYSYRRASEAKQPLEGAQASIVGLR